MKKYLVSIILLSFTVILVAQSRGGRPKIENMHEKKWDFIVENTHLSGQEVELVKPVFMQYENSVWNLHEEGKRNFRRQKKLMEGKTDLNYSELNDKYIETEIEQAKLLENYHLKLKSLLSPEKLFNYYQAERMYKRQLMENMRQDRTNQRNRK